MVTIPPFCPHTDCCYHQGDHRQKRFWIRRGFYTRNDSSHRIQRFLCRGCNRSFSSMSFSLDYTANRRISYRLLLRLLVSCCGIRATARVLAVSPQTVINRVSRLARSLSVGHYRLLSYCYLAEPLVLDGLVGFCQSQFHPTNIPLLAGFHSQFVYLWDYARVRRSGRMTPEQRRERTRRDRFYPCEPAAERAAVIRLLCEAAPLLTARRSPDLCIESDENTTYPAALRAVPYTASLLYSGTLTHRRTNSQLPRTIHNPLFSANYVDRERRKNLAEYVRETTRFGRNANNQSERFWLFVFSHNYLTPHRVRIGTSTHAAYAGLSERAIRRVLRVAFTRRVFASREHLTWALSRLWGRERRTPKLPLPVAPPRYVSA